MPVEELARAIGNDQVGPRLWLLRAESPRIAASLEPGQFTHLRVPGMEAHVLRRPFSVYDADPHAGTIEILYQDVGFGTHRLTQLAPGETFSQIGPVGRGWSGPEGARSVLCVGGGVGAAPLFLQVKRLVDAGVRVDVVLGAQTRAALVTLERYEEVLGRPPVTATDDGSFGHAGFATVPVMRLLADNVYDRVLCCGPEPLMRIVADLAADAGAPCEVSLERRMACGVGACLSCVVDTRAGKRRACVDGPVFDASEVVWR